MATTGYKRGASGPPVVEIQQRLLVHGFSIGPYGVDGKFGPDTAAAVTAFQSAYGLRVDGIVGPETLSFLRTDPPEKPASAPRQGRIPIWVGVGAFIYLLWRNR